MAAETPRPAPTKPVPRNRKILKLVLNWGPTLLFNIVGPLLVYSYLVDHGHSKTVGIMVSSLLPLVELAAIYLFTRRVDDFGVFTLFTMFLTLLSFLAFNSPKALLYKDSGITGVLGLCFFVSLGMRRPLAYYLGRKFSTDGSRVAFEWWEGLWEYPNFRKTNRVITVIWGSALCLEAAIRIVLIGLMSVRTMVGLSPVLTYTVVGIATCLTFWYGRRSQAEVVRLYGPEAILTPDFGAMAAAGEETTGGSDDNGDNGSTAGSGQPVQ